MNSKATKEDVVVAFNEHRESLMKIKDVSVVFPGYSEASENFEAIGNCLTIVTLSSACAQNLPKFVITSHGKRVPLVPIGRIVMDTKKYVNDQKRKK